MMTDQKNLSQATQQDAQTFGSEMAPGSFAVGRSIAHAVVIKDRDVFFLTEPDGRVPLQQAHGFGLYYHDCRYLNGYALKVSGQRPESLVWTAERGYMAVIGLTNPDMQTADGTVILKHNVGIKMRRLIDGARLALYDVITFENLAFHPLGFEFSLTFHSSFEDLFEVRSFPRERRGQAHPPVWQNDTLNFFYEGADDIYRSLMVHFSPPPLEAKDATAHFQVQLRPKESRHYLVSLFIKESRDPQEAQTVKEAPPNLKRVEATLEQASVRWLERDTQVFTDSLVLDRIVHRSLLDLNMLRSYMGKEEYFAAGVPWFVAVFGRDSIITALQTLAYNPGIAEHTIRLLAGYQGRQLDEWREEEPGKILHEIRLGEMANLNEVPHTPYYGTIDATPLFLILIGRHAAWTGDISVFNELRSNVEAALAWIDRHGDIDGDGYVEYIGSTGKGLLNQGWKDSGDAVVNADGTLATPPIALVEVQGYVYMAKTEMAHLYRQAGETERAEALEREAEDLRRRFSHDFWVENGFYALALQDGKRPAAVMSSNAGHALWAGIADPEKAQQTAERLMADDMFNGWGIRTLSAKEIYYNPLGYHLGTVWPHDNSMIAAGFRRYGLDAAALRIFVGLVEAAVHFDHHRLPELFAGFHRDDYGVPVAYPVACQPQAWAAGTVPYMLKTLLGLTPEAFEHRLRITRPILPGFVNQVEIHGLRVGAARVDLKFERVSDSITAKILKLDGRLDVVVEL